MNSSGEQIRVRLAPSPTGPLHLGTARTALFNWLFARQNQGVFILRIEDTDRERSQKKYEEELLRGLHWLGLDWDEGPDLEQGKKIGEMGGYGPYHQSQRTTIYQKHLEKLLQEKKAYYCYCTKDELEAQRQVMLSEGLPPKYSGHCRDLENPLSEKIATSIRFKISGIQVEFKDSIRGKIVFDTSLFGDIVIAKNMETPLYNFAAVVDDEEMQISHVIRGEDHIANTPKQILIQRALGFKEPLYAHLPLILQTDRSKLSKRFSEVSLLSYREEGYLPEALINFLAFLGWHPQSNKEIYSREELVQEFNMKRVQKGGAVFDKEKLQWLNAQHIKNLGGEELFNRLKEFLDQQIFKSSFLKNEKLLRKVVEVERGRLKTLADFGETASFFFEPPEYQPDLLVWKNELVTAVKKNLEDSLDVLKKTEGDGFVKEKLSSSLKNLVEERGTGAVLWPLRVAVSGQAASPDPIAIMEALGKEESLRRITTAISKLENNVT